MQLQPEGRHCSEVQGDDADDESAGGADARAPRRRAPPGVASGPPGVASAPPGAGPASAGAPRPVANNKLKGTMVGVAPPVMPVAGKPGGPSSRAPRRRSRPELRRLPRVLAPCGRGSAAGGFGGRPRRTTGPPQQHGRGASAAAAAAVRSASARSRSTERRSRQQFGGGQGVNPLGGTMAAGDAAAFNPYAPRPRWAYGPPPAPVFGAPPPQAPPDPYGGAAAAAVRGAAAAGGTDAASGSVRSAAAGAAGVRRRRCRSRDSARRP